MPESVVSTVCYLGNPEGERPYWGSPDSGKGCNFIDTPYKVEITDLRSLSADEQAKFTLDSCGFQVLKHEAKEKLFEDPKKVEGDYYAECAEFFKKHLGCSRVEFFDNTIRRQKAGGDYAGGPAVRVHVDQTKRAGFKRVEQLGGADAPELLKGRCQIVNLWRPIRGPVKDTPLAFVDGRTMNYEKDCVAGDVYYTHFTGESYGIRHNPDHKWYYYSDMMPDDIILLKCFDSIDEPNGASMTPHTAFGNPNAPKDHPHRMSIEIRAMLFWDPKPEN